VKQERNPFDTRVDTYYNQSHHIKGVLIMAKYIYPAVFTMEEKGYSVNFPDLESCYTSGENLQNAIEMAKDVLCLMLYDLEENKKPIPIATEISKMTTGHDSFASLIDCDTMEYRRFYDNKAVKKTLTIPSWLNAMAEREHINFSAVLQKALKEQLNC
jgi:predicted RNase H-like HicB family nuclease